MEGEITPSSTVVSFVLIRRPFSPGASQVFVVPESQLRRSTRSPQSTLQTMCKLGYRAIFDLDTVIVIIYLLFRMPFDTALFFLILSPNFFFSLLRTSSATDVLEGEPCSELTERYSFSFDGLDRQMNVSYAFCFYEVVDANSPHLPSRRACLTLSLLSL